MKLCIDNVRIQDRKKFKKEVKNIAQAIILLKNNSINI